MAKPKAVFPQIHNQSSGHVQCGRAVRKTREEDRGVRGKMQRSEETDLEELACGSKSLRHSFQNRNGTHGFPASRKQFRLPSAQHELRRRRKISRETCNKMTEI